MDFKSYPNYKDSGVEWLGKVPEHWSSIAIKFLATEKNSLFIDGDWIESKDISDEGIKYITTGNVSIGAYKEKGSGFISDKTFYELSCKEVFENDILISRLNLPVGRSCLVPNLNCRVVTSVDNVIFRPDAKYSREYLVYLFSSLNYLYHTETLARGATMQRISRTLLGDIRISIPKLQEQNQIVSFLDSETSRIDNLIAKQEKLIEKLEEHRKSVISHAVTKGLDPNAPMKDSGVEWLGEVPEHWILKPIKFLSKINQSTLAETTDENLDIQYVDIGSVSATYGIEKIEQYVFSQAPSRARRIVADKDIIVSTVRTYLKAITYIENPPKNLIVSTGFAVLTPIERVIKPQFAKSAFLAEQFIAEVISKSKGISYPAITASELAAIKIALPPIEEQDQIVKLLDEKTSKIDTLIAKQRELIAKLKNYRTSIISHAVTGKIDVRDLVA